MPQNQKIATIFGGTGFLGRHIVRNLAKAGYTVKIATRAPERAYFLKTAGTVGQIAPISCDYMNADSIAAAIKGSSVVVNCIGVLFEKGRRRKFKYVHVDIAQKIAALSAAHKVQRLIHISALGVDKANSKYAKTKRAGELAVLEAFPNATILRPSVMFGEGDGFFNMLATMALYFPFLPLIGGGKTKFQPVFVGDVADAALAAITLPDMNDDNVPEIGPHGKTYELGGPEILSFRDIYKRIFVYTKRKSALISLPFFWMKFKATFIGLLPNPPLTRDQVETLKTDNIVTPGALGFKDLGVEATPMDLIVPHYLARFQPGGRFGATKTPASNINRAA